MGVLNSLSAKQKQLILDIMYWPYIPRDIVFCWCKGIRRKPGWRFWRLPVISIKGRKSSLSIGKSFTACSEVSHNSLGVFQKVVLKTVGHGASIVIGDHVGMSGCVVSASTAITIGNYVLLGSGCLVTDSDAHPIDPEERRQGKGGASKPIVIEDDVFVGTRAIILKGVTIGKGSVIGAGCVVAKSIPPYSVVVGNPAKIIADSRTCQ